MATRVQFLLLLIIGSVVIGGDASNFNRKSFGEKFVFGTASAPYQYEGAYQADDKMPSNWDVYSNKFPERIIDGSNGNVAVDQYHRYKEDVGLLHNIGFDAYCFSISWSRIMTRLYSQNGLDNVPITDNEMEKMSIDVEESEENTPAESSKAVHSKRQHCKRSCPIDDVKDILENMNN